MPNNQKAKTEINQAVEEFLERFTDLIWQSLEQSKKEKRELTNRPQILCETYPTIELQNKT